MFLFFVHDNSRYYQCAFSSLLSFSTLFAEIDCHAPNYDYYYNKNDNKINHNNSTYPYRLSVCCSRVKRTRAVRAWVVFRLVKVRSTRFPRPAGDSFILYYYFLLLLLWLLRVGMLQCVETLATRVMGYGWGLVTIFIEYLRYNSISSCVVRHGEAGARPRGWFFYAGRSFYFLDSERNGDRNGFTLMFYLFFFFLSSLYRVRVGKK